MPNRHLAHELEHLHACHVQQEQVTTLLAQRRPPVERVTHGAILGEQRRAARAGRASTRPTTGSNDHDRQPCDSEPGAHRTSVRGSAGDRRSTVVIHPALMPVPAAGGAAESAVGVVFD